MTKRLSLEYLVFILVCLLWLVLRTPNLGSELGLRMDAVIASMSTYVNDSWANEPTKRLFAPVDNRFHFEKLATRELKPYVHTPPLATLPLGLTTVFFGMKEWQLRLGSVLMSLLFLICHFAFARRWLGFQTALWSSIIMATCAQSMHYSRNADPLLHQIFWLPLMAWAYLGWLKSDQTRDRVIFYFLSFLAMLSFWSNFGIFGALLLHRTISRRGKSFLLDFSSATALVLLALTVILLYAASVLGGLQPLMEDFSSSVSGRTSGIHGFWDLVNLDLIRYPKYYGLIVCLGVFCYTLRCVFGKEEHRYGFLFFLMFGGLTFPYYVSTVSYVHEYYTMAFLPPAAIMLAHCLQALAKSSRTLPLLILAFAVVAHISQGLWVGYNRMIRYDKDYLLSRRLGQCYLENVTPGILLTDSRDLEFPLQYYSRAKVSVTIDNLNELKKALRTAKRDHTESFVFISTTSPEALEGIPELKDFPESKLTGEFSLEPDKEGPLWTYLLNRFRYEKHGPFTIFDLTTEKS